MNEDDVMRNAPGGEPAPGSVEKKAYRVPTLTRYGSVEELTTQEGMSPIAGIIPTIIDLIIA